jgi:hypothetical protein
LAKTLFKNRLGAGGGAKFEAFCQGRFGIKKRYANEQIQGYRVADALKKGKCLTLPANTSITTELGRLCETQPEKLVPAWRETLVRAEATGKPPDSRIAREVVAEILPPTPGKDAQPPTNLAAKSKVVVKHLTTAKKEIAAILDAEPNNQSTVAVVDLLRSIEKMARVLLPRWAPKLPSVGTVAEPPL